MNCGRLDAASLATLRRLGIRYVAVHRALFRLRRREDLSCTATPERSLRSFRVIASDGQVTIYGLGHVPG
jgi:hypothetical protein